MLALRFLATLFLLVATIVFVADVTPFAAGTGPFKTTTLLGHWRELAPDTLKAAKAGVSRATAPVVWDGIAAVMGAAPTFLLFAALGLASGYLGRRRHSVKPFAN